MRADSRAITNLIDSVPALTAIRDTLTDTPFERKVFLVGGAVRDAVMGRPPSSDLDFVLEGDVSELVEFLYRSLKLTKTPAIFERFGTAMLTIRDVQCEFVNARKESYHPDSRKPDVRQGTLRDDALRRDFTVNALMADLWTAEVVDVLETGLSDLDSKVLRTPLDPGVTFSDDPLRMLRAVRFKHKLGFELDRQVIQAIKDHSGRMEIVSPERIQLELDMILLGPNRSVAMQDLMDLGLLDVLIPEFRDLVGVEQGHFHHKDVWGHTLEVLDYAPLGDLELAWACLLHDIAKPKTKTIESDGRIRFFGHESVGAEMAGTILRRLRYSNDQIQTVKRLVRNHMRVSRIEDLKKPGLRRILRDMDGVLEPFLELLDADSKAHHPDMPKQDIARLRAKLNSVKKETPVETLKSPLSGFEIISEFDLQPGERIKAIKAHLEQLVIDGELNSDDKPGAILAARKFLNR